MYIRVAGSHRFRDALFTVDAELVRVCIDPNKSKFKINQNATCVNNLAKKDFIKHYGEGIDYGYRISLDRYQILAGAQSKYTPVILEPDLPLERIPKALGSMTIRYIERDPEQFASRMVALLYDQTVGLQWQSEFGH